MNEKNLQMTIGGLREFIQLKGWSIAVEKEIQSGYQLVVTDGAMYIPINFYLTGKILIQGKAGLLQSELQSWKQELNTGLFQPSRPQNTQSSSLNNEVGRKARFHVSQHHFEEVKQLFSRFNAQVIVQEPLSDQHQFFRIDIHRGNEKVVATQYKNGTLLIQGRASELFEDICAALENIFSQSFAERGARYVPVSEQNVILEHMNHPQSEQKALSWVNKYLGQQVYEFLPSNDRETYLSGAGLLLSIEETNLQLSDYSIIVMPFARAYEGFIIQLTVHLNIAKRANIQDYSEPMKVGNYLNQIEAKIKETSKNQYGGLVDTLQSVWRDVRNKVLHSDPVNPSLHQQLVNAMQDIHTINRAMRRGHKYLVELGIIKLQAVKSQAALSDNEVLDITRVDTEGAQAPLKQNEYKVTTPRPNAEFKAPARARIGVDESGKGDYFGPLVIGAAYVDERIEAQLIALGVRDSKRLPDNRILQMAEEIKIMCPYSVVTISPKRYNELYQSFHNLNRLLAWGHARSLENVLGKVSCDLAVSDQFGDESFLLNALMEKGRQIKLEQRPRAEEDIAVAAASILARAEFVRRMEQLSKQIGKTLPKGSSSPSIETIGREIVELGGQVALAEVAKLHFKTTQTILQGHLDKGDQPS